MSVLIVTGGKIDRSFGMEFLKTHSFDNIIAVDGGLAFADEADRLLKSGGFEAGLMLTDIVGDFDTIDKEIIDKYKGMSDGPVIHEFIPEKDNTDTDIALRLAVKLCQTDEGKKQEIWILGATGTRLDHVLANITMLLMPFAAGIDAYLADANNRICLLSGTKRIRKSEQFGKYVSLIPLTPQIKGITLEGMKYPLTNHEIRMGSSLCVSNEIIGDEAVLTVEEGIAVLLETKD